MSVELPEALVLAEQLTISILEKNIKQYDIQDSQRLQKIDFMNKDLKDYDRLLGCKVKSISQRGNTIRIQMSKKMNIVMCPDYGASILYHESDESLPKKYHFKVEFSDGTYLTVR